MATGKNQSTVENFLKVKPRLMPIIPFSGASVDLLNDSPGSVVSARLREQGRPHHPPTSGRDSARGSKGRERRHAHHDVLDNRFAGSCFTLKDFVGPDNLVVAYFSNFCNFLLWRLKKASAFYSLDGFGNFYKNLSLSCSWSFRRFDRCSPL